MFPLFDNCRQRICEKSGYVTRTSRIELHIKQSEF